MIRIQDLRTRAETIAVDFEVFNILFPGVAMRIQISVLALAGVFSIGCGDASKSTSESSSDSESKASGETGASVLESALKDLKEKRIFTDNQDIPGSIFPIDPDKLVEGLKGNSAFYHNAPDEGGDDGCLVAAINKFIPEVGDGYMYFKYEGDVKNCTDDATTGMKSAKLQLFAVLACEGGNFDSLKGTKFQKLTSVANDVCKDSKSLWSLLQMKFSADSEEKDSDAATTMDRYSSIYTSTQSNDGDFCHATRDDAGAITEETCTILDKYIYPKYEVVDIESGKATTVAAVAGKTVGYDLLSYDKLTGKKDAKFYDSGTAQFTHGNWKGEIIFNGADSLPVWSLNNGTLDKSGTFEED